MYRMDLSMENLDKRGGICTMMQNHATSISGH